MRINKYVASASSLSRRGADAAIEQGRVLVNGHEPTPGQDVTDKDLVSLDGRVITAPAATITIMLNKPVGYVVSRDGQGSETIYDVLPEEYRQLQPIGRLDKFSSGLLLLTSDGQLANELAHPRYVKTKVYEVLLGQELAPLHRQMISDHGVKLADGVSKFQLERMEEGNDRRWRISMTEGRNRQIRRTFLSLGYGVSRLHRTQFGEHSLGTLATGRTRVV